MHIPDIAELIQAISVRSIERPAELFDSSGGNLSMASQEHVRAIKPLHPTVRTSRNNLLNVPPTDQAICAPMQAKQRAFGLD
jgi:hypothetical protein